MTNFLLKTEPSDFSFADLVREGSCIWTGVSNPAARIVLRTIRRGDQALIYHTGDERAVVGLARVTRGAYPDPTRPGLNDRGEPNYPVIDLAPVRSANPSLSLAAIKSDPRFEGFTLITHGRLSVHVVPEATAGPIARLCGW
ncbi:MAG: ubiquinol-cytochrome c reductase [Phycisphaerae bacterium]|nr:MAG: ubiquinol-cytochrome c reductase [Phycisphaerae bacterium]